ncbi:MAG: efflux RND transporter periplasmic adaptor subunit [Firmicutes bacterium]|nr:efflux RND transporter periplasmic adaptor subunit [Bacillota bacterium]
MKNRRGLAIIITGILLIGLVGFYTYREQNKYANNSPAVAQLPVVISPVVTKDFSETLTYHGSLAAKAQVYVIPKVPGRVEQVFVEVGDQVNQGDLLIQLETAELLLHKKQAEAGVAAAKAQLEKALTGARPEEIEQALANLQQVKASYEATVLTVERARPLYQAGLMSSQDWDGLQAQLSVAEAQLNLAEQAVAIIKQGARKEDLAMAEAALSQAQATYDLARLSLENAGIKAPITGVVSQVLTEAGSLVGSTGPVVTIIDSSTVKLTVMASEHEVVKIQPGQIVDLQVNALPDLKIQGIVKTVAPMGDLVGGLFPITIEIPNRQGLLKPGMYCTANLEVSNELNALAIPSKAVIQTDSFPQVYVIQNGKAQLVPVKLGLKTEGYAQVISGVNLGDNVVVSGQNRLSPGAEVRVIRMEEGF